jgi:hypothetical protein
MDLRETGGVAWTFVSLLIDSNIIILITDLVGYDMSHERDYEDHFLLGCHKVSSGRNLLTFRRNVLPTSSRLKRNLSMQTAIRLRYILLYLLPYPTVACRRGAHR